MSTFSIRLTPLPGLSVVDRSRREDARGFFSRLFCAQELAEAGFDAPIAQINHSLTRKRGAVRGMHFQYPPHAEIKLVSVMRGEVFDVAIDLRKDSPTFLRWHAQVLSAENRRSLLIPHGFAHGFQTLTEDCELVYLHSTAYAPHAEAGIRAQDPAVGILWPLPFAELSARDASHPLIGPDFRGVEL
jgi:dTDP-4-dehydrorhamnose 3,5-epimerase